MMKNDVYKVYITNDRVIESIQLDCGITWMKIELEYYKHMPRRTIKKCSLQ